jgi:hypothetical protein
MTTAVRGERYYLSMAVRYSGDNKVKIVEKSSFLTNDGLYYFSKLNAELGRNLIMRIKKRRKLIKIVRIKLRLVTIKSRINCINSM